jgi:hypothetical protein
VVEELPLHERGYRCVRADYAPFQEDRKVAEWHGDRAGMLDALGAYCRANGLALETQNTEVLADAELLHAIAVTLPFHPAEKQALLESDSMETRQRDLMELLRMGGEVAPDNTTPVGPLN